jgi:hypothetical protein
MDRADKEYYERMLTLTSYPEWQEFVDDLKRLIYQEQCNILEDAKSWDEVTEKRGMCKAYSEIADLRSQVKVALDEL